MRAAGWERKQCLPEMRKWYGAEMATKTGDLYLVQKLLGHADPQTTTKTYESLTRLSNVHVDLPQRA